MAAPLDLEAHYHPSWICLITQDVMTDPVICSDGHSYERAAIQRWLATSNRSPATGAVLANKTLTPNHALRNAIEEGLKELRDNYAREQERLAAAIVPPPHAAPANSANAATNQVSLQNAKIVVKRTRVDASTLLVNVSSTSDESLPLSLICVLDVSGSMASPSSEPGEGKMEAARFSRLDLVKHSVNTAVMLMRPVDKLSIVTFSDEARVILDKVPMDDRGKEIAVSQVDAMQSGGGTNLWGGLNLALGLAQEMASTTTASSTAVNVAIVLQTDGEPTPDYSPGRGILPSLRVKHTNRLISIHTIAYGFGESLDSPLLRGISKIGNGTYQYIPDGSMVGTVFIHLMANLLSTAACGVSVYEGGPEIGILQAKDPKGKTFVISASAYGNNNNNAAATGGSRPVRHHVVEIDRASIPANDVMYHILRFQFVQVLEDAVKDAESGEFEVAIAKVRSFYDKLAPFAHSDPRIEAIRADLLDQADPSRGQITKALQFWRKWGMHYLPGVLFAHSRQEIANFRDESMRAYPSEELSRMIARGEEVFLNIKPPKPSCDSTVTMGSISSLAYPAAHVSMAAMLNRGGVCFGGGCRIAMAGNGLSKPIRQIRKGDVLEGGAAVRCAVRFFTTAKEGNAIAVIVNTRSSEERDGEEYDDGMTAYHPIRDVGGGDGKWRFPVEALASGQARLERRNEVYNLVLDRCHRVRVVRTGKGDAREFEAVTLGHGLKEGPVVEHAYYGTSRVVEDLRRADPLGFESGLVSLDVDRLTWSRGGPGGTVDGMSYV